MRIHKLVWKKCVILIRKRCPESERTRSRIDLVVKYRYCSGGQFCLLSSVESIDCEVPTMTQLTLDLAEVIFSYAEDDGYRLKLGNNNNSVRIGRVNDVSRIKKSKTDATGDRR